MAEVIGFRPSPEEWRLVERTRRALGFKTRADALRFLLRKGAEQSGPLANDPVFRLRIPELRAGRKGLSSREIDEELYGA